jgi:hypothetical protein
MLSYAAYKNTRLPPIVNRPMIELGGGFKLGKPVLGSVPFTQSSPGLTFAKKASNGVNSLKIEESRLKVETICNEQHCVDFHQQVLNVLKLLEIEPSDLKPLHKARTANTSTVNSKSERTLALFVTAFSNAYGMDFNSGERVTFRLCPSVIPFHIASGFALVSMVIPGMVFNSIYKKYIARITYLVEFLESKDEDLSDYVDCVKKIVGKHSKITTIRFLSEFYILCTSKWCSHAVDCAQKIARSWLNELIPPVNAAIKLIKHKVEIKQLKLKLKQVSKREK